MQLELRVRVENVNYLLLIKLHSVIRIRKDILTEIIAVLPSVLCRVILNNVVKVLLDFVLHLGYVFLVHEANTGRFLKL